MSTPHIRTALIAATLVASATTTLAANVTLTGWAYGSGNTVSARAPSMDYNGWAGGFAGALSGAPGFNNNDFLTYCIELEESFSFGVAPMTGYNIIEGKRYFSEFRGDRTIADRLGKLMTFAADHNDLVNNAAGSTALQLAIWNLVYDTDYSVGTQAGRFSDISSYSGAASDLLAGAQGVATSRFNVYALQRFGSQDFLLLSPVPQLAEVPEPAGLALGMLALGAAGYAGRRRSKRQN